MHQESSAKFSITVEDYLNVANKVRELGCAFPAGIAAMPDNFDAAVGREDLRLKGESSTLLKVLREGGIEVGTFLNPGESMARIHNKTVDWAAVIFVSAALMNGNPAAVTIGLNILSNYLTDLFKGTPDRNVKLSIVIERKRDRSCKRIRYEGPPEGLNSLPQTILDIVDE